MVYMKTLCVEFHLRSPPQFGSLRKGLMLQCAGKQRDIELWACQTHMKESLSVIHPSYDNVRVWHLSVAREAEANPTRSLYANSKRNGFCCIVEGPVQFIETSVFCSIQSDIERIGFREVVSTRGETQRASQHSKLK